MSEAAMSSTVPSAPAKIEISGGDEMSPAEKSYFSSRGQDTSGLAPSPEPTPAPEAQQNAAPPEDDDIEDGEIEAEGIKDGRDVKTGRFVPKSAMLRYKADAKQAKSEAQQLRDGLIAARERLAILTEAAQPTSEAAQVIKDIADEPDIDPEVDVFGAIKQMKARNERLTKALQQNSQQQQAFQRQNAFKQDVERVSAETPDWKDAFQFLVNRQHAIMEAMGETDVASRNARLAQEAQSVINDAIAKGQSPAQAFYKLAKAAGYQAKAAAPADQLAKAQEELQRLEQNKANSASLRGAGTGGVGQTLTRAAVANMSEDQYFAARSDYIGRHGEAAWTRLMRGS